MLINGYSCTKLLFLMACLCLAFEGKTVSAKKCTVGYRLRPGKCEW
ncbi:uncharacterized protein LOC120445144 [Drosophila santomea]|nr:uncharacterized protein LOC120445144 [Drosophila santomea]